MADRALGFAPPTDPELDDCAAGHAYEGHEPDGYMTAAETVATLEAYRRSFEPPLHTGIEVEAACRTGTGFEVRTSDGTWHCDAVVAATGGVEPGPCPGLRL